MNLSTTDPAGHLARYGYYPDGRLKTLTDPNGKVATLKHNIQNRLTPPFCANLCTLYMRHAI